MPLEYRLWANLDGNREWSALNDLTPHVYRAQWKLGRDATVTLAGITNAGTMQITCANYDGRFNVNNPASPYFGRLRPYTDLVVDASDDEGESWQRLATMQVEKVEPLELGSGRKTAVISAAGVFAELASQNALVRLESTGGLETTGEFCRRILSHVMGIADPALQGLRWDLDPGQTQVSHSYLFNTGGVIGGARQTPVALNGLRYLEKLEIGHLYEDREGRVVFRNRRHRWDARKETPDVNLTDQEQPLPFGPLNLRQGFSVHIIHPRDSWDDVFNVIAAASATLQVQEPREDLFVYNPSGQALPTPLGPGAVVAVDVTDNRVDRLEETSVLNWTAPVLATVDNWGQSPEVVVSSGNPSATVLAGINNATVWALVSGSPGTLAGQIVTQNGEVISQSASALPLATPAEVELTFNNAVSPPTVTLRNQSSNTLWLWRISLGGVLSRLHEYDAEELVDDEEGGNSIALFGRREWRYPVEILRVAGPGDTAGRDEVEEHLRALLTVYRFPRQHLVVRFRADSSPLHEWHALRRSINDQVNVTYGAAGVEAQRYWLEYEKHELTQAGDHWVEWGLTNQEQSEPWAKVGDDLSGNGRFIRVGY